MKRYFLKVGLVQLVAFVLSPFVVLLGMPFVRENKSRVSEYSIYVKPTLFNRHFDLPDWLKWWQNEEDGMTGDHRGWYWNVYCKDWAPDWLKMWWWSGVRNPANYLKRQVMGVDVRNYTIEKVKGDDYVRDDFDSTGFQILKADPLDSAETKWALYWVRRWGQSNRAIVVQLGAKIKVDHNGVKYEEDRDYWKGVTFEINPAKDIS